ncbi:MAG: Hsp33 family molecular chaperone HslO [Candidatus Eremiobacteraeota bacterium]|nr:Hsp33 family molecular chaperone HslO [Candidatus Eremiobacteraeota bacterium]
MADQLIAASAPDAGITIVAGITTELVAQAQQRHGLSPTATAAVGRLMTGAALLGIALKGRERMSLQIAGDGPIRAIVADVMLMPNGTVGVRGYAKNPEADLPLNALGKFDVAGAVGSGSLQVTKSYEIGQPYVGIVPLVSGEIGEDLASYLANSQQIPSAVAVGVLANPSGVMASGGVIGQVMPGASEKAVAYLEERALAMLPVSQQVAEGASASDLLAALAGDMELKHHRTIDVEFACRCTREKVEIALLGLGKDELLKIAAEQPETAATCEFCKKTYTLSASDVNALVQRLDER